MLRVGGRHQHRVVIEGPVACKDTDEHGGRSHGVAGQSHPAAERALLNEKFVNIPRLSRTHNNAWRPRPTTIHDIAAGPIDQSCCPPARQHGVCPSPVPSSSREGRHFAVLLVCTTRDIRRRQVRFSVARLKHGPALPQSPRAQPRPQEECRPLSPAPARSRGALGFCIFQDPFCIFQDPIMSHKCMSKWQ